MNYLIFDFDRFSLNEAIIGEELLDDNELGNFDNKECGYRLYFDKSTVVGAFICIRSGYEGYKNFCGLFFKNGEKICFSKDNNPDDVLKIFGDPVDRWNDGVEVNIQFLLKNSYRIEFSWQIIEMELELNYIIVELD